MIIIMNRIAERGMIWRRKIRNIRKSMQIKKGDDVSDRDSREREEEREREREEELMLQQQRVCGW